MKYEQSFLIFAYCSFYLGIWWQIISGPIYQVTGSFILWYQPRVNYYVLSAWILNSKCWFFAFAVPYVRGWTAFSEIHLAFLDLLNVRFLPFAILSLCILEELYTCNRSFTKCIPVLNNLTCLQLLHLLWTVVVIDPYQARIILCINLMLPLLELHHIMLQENPHGVLATLEDSWMRQTLVL